LKVLVTSRVVLHLQGEHNYEVPTLTLPPAGHRRSLEQLARYEGIRLFVERARAARSEFRVTTENASAVIELCRRLDGLPLAIELAAARIKLLPPQAMLSRLGNRLKLLTGGARNLPQRQRTLRGAIEWSYALLDEGEKMLFTRLAVFSGGSTLEAVEAVCDAEGDLPVDVFEGVSSLLDKSLLQQKEGFDGEPRFAMLETIREYASERLEDSSDAEAARHAHAEYFLALAEEAEPMLWGAEDAAWLDRLEEEHDNMRAALSWAIRHDEDHLALELGGALRWFWFTRGYYGEGRKWLEEALVKDLWASAEARAKALDGVGRLAYEQGDIDRAESAAEEGLELSGEAEIGGVVAADLRNILGEAASHRGNHERAKELLEESLALHQEAGDRRGVAWSLGSLANASGDRGDHEGAQVLYEQGLVLARELGGARLLGAYLISLGYEFLLQGDLENATELNEEAAALFRKQGSKGGLEYVLDNLGWAALLQGDHEQAKALHEESLMLCRELGDERIASESLEGLACSEGAKGELERAARLFGAAQALREAVGYQQTPREHALREPYLVDTRSQMNEVAWAEAWEAGRSMTFEDAIAYALGEHAGA